MKILQWLGAGLLILSGLVNLFTTNFVFAPLITLAMGVLLLPIVSDKLPFPRWTLILVFIAGISASVANEPRQVMATNTAQSDSLEVANDRARKMESDINSAHIRAHRAVKNTLKDPDSFEEITHRSGFVGENGVYVACLLEYRAKNGFGGFAVGKSLVNFDEAMGVIGVIPVE